MENNIEQEFARTYDNIVNSSPGPIGYFNTRNLDADFEGMSVERVIAQSIDDFETEKDKLVRADAKLLLLINLTAMVFTPLTTAANQDASFVKREIYSLVKLVLERANDFAQEISSHKVLEAGLALWPSLNILKDGSW